MNRTVLAWARMLGGIGILAVLLWRLGTGAFLDGLRALDGRVLLAAVGIGLLTTGFSAWRWCLVARGLGIRLALPGAVADYYRALFLNAALPGGILGDVHRAVRHGRDVGDVGRSVRAVVLERFAGQAVLVPVAVAVLAIAHPGSVGWAGAATIGAAALVLWLRSRPADSRAGRAAADVRLGLFGRDNWPGILLSSVLVLAGHLATFLVAARAAGSTASITRLAPLALLSLLAMTVPMNVGGWGPREGVTAWAFGAAGLGSGLGLTTAVVYGLLAFAAALPGAAVLLTRWITRLRGAVAQRAPQPEPAGAAP